MLFGSTVTGRRSYIWLADAAGHHAQCGSSSTGRPARRPTHSRDLGAVGPRAGIGRRRRTRCHAATLARAGTHQLTVLAHAARPASCSRRPSCVHRQLVEAATAVRSPYERLAARRTTQCRDEGVARQPAGDRGRGQLGRVAGRRPGGPRLRGRGRLPRRLAARRAGHGAGRRRSTTGQATRSPGPSVPGEVARVRRIINGVKPDLVHLHSSKAGLAGRLAMRGSLPDGLPAARLVVPGDRRRRSSRRRSAGSGFGSRWADRILCVSEGEADEAAEIGIRRDRLAVVSNGVDLTRLARRRLPSHAPPPVSGWASPPTCLSSSTSGG